jgi:uncharacterized protein YgiM (DUF1202 family)
MKKTYLLILGVMVATSVTAQNPTNMPAIPPPANTVVSAPVTVPAAEVAPTNSPAPAKKKKSKKKKATAAKVETTKQVFTEATVTLVPGPAEVSVAHLNVRGQAGLKGEVVTHLQKGDSVTVLSELTLDKHKADEPSQWARIVLPAGNGVWVRSSFIDEATKTVKPKKLNLRGGPGENYSVLGVIDRGTVVNEQAAKGEWSKIEVPTNAYAFIAAMYLKQEASGSLPVNPSPSTETAVTPVTPTPVTVGESQQINTVPATPETVPAPATPDANVVPPPALNPPVVIQTNIITIIDTNVPPPPPRIVTHEGFVRSSISPVAPTYFELYDPATSTAINYLFSTTTNLDLARYKGLHINVTGEEGLDARWRDTPVLSVQKIFVLSPSAPAAPAATADTTKKSKTWYHLW